MISEPFKTMGEVRAEIDSWGTLCRQCGARFFSENGEQFCDGC